MNKKTIKNPCIRNCNYNDENICISCFRTQKEIYFWGDLTDEQKNDVFKKIPERRSKIKNHNL